MKIINKIFNRLSPKINFSVGLIFSGTIFILIFAYCVRFLTVSSRTIRSGLESISIATDDSAKSLGISTNLKVFDTQNRTSEVASIAGREDFSNYDVVIGPMMIKNFDRFASEVKDDAVPVFAPLTLPSKVSRNVYQTIPNKKILSQKMINYVKQDSTINQVYIISDQKHRAESNNLKNKIN